MWGPVLGWCVLELLAESIDAQHPERVALDLFDRLRLREPFAQAFAALGFEGEEGWRVAARIKVVLLTGAGVGRQEENVTAARQSPAVADALVDVYEATTAEDELAIPASDPAPGEKTPVEDEKVALSPDLWLDPDVRWLTGVHEAEGKAYLVRESYEELLWWLLIPALLRLAGETAPSRAAVEQISKTVEEALTTAEAAGYRIDALLGTAEEINIGEAVEAEVEVRPKVPEEPQMQSEKAQPEELGPHEPSLESQAVTMEKPARPGL
jgi:hypothetical protein